MKNNTFNKVMILVAVISLIIFDNCISKEFDPRAGFYTKNEFDSAVTYFHSIIDSIKEQDKITHRDKKLIEEKLQFAEQKREVLKKNSITYLTLSSLFFAGLLISLYFHYRHKITKQKKILASESAAWNIFLEGEKKERNKVAHELLHHIGENISTVFIWMENIQRQLKGKLKVQEKEYGHVLKLLDNTLVEVKKAAHHLMPELLLRLGLIEAIRIFCRNTENAAGINIHFQYIGYMGSMQKGIELIVFRTIQELMKNIVNHAKASNAIVQISQHEKVLVITVEDDGKGFYIPDLKETKGIGLASIQKNMKSLGARFQINSFPNKGTTIEIELATDNIKL